MSCEATNKQAMLLLLLQLFQLDFRPASEDAIVFHIRHVSASHGVTSLRLREDGRATDGRHWQRPAASPDVTCRVVNSSFINYVARPSQVVRHHCSVDCANFSPLTCRNSVCGVADRCARCHCGFVSCQVTPLFCCLLTRDGNSYAS